MKVLIVNKFLYPKGGDAVCALNTGSLLEANGHEVAYWGMDHPSNGVFAYREFFVPRVDYGNPGGFGRAASAAMKLLYSRDARERLTRLLKVWRPDIAHLHNFAHQLSPSILDALKEAGVPSVMTMHDYKMVCGAYKLRAAGINCEACTGGRYFNCLARKCVKGSFAKSALSTFEMYLHHSAWDIYGSIKTFIAPSRFMQAKLAEMGFKKQVVHLPNFARVPGSSEPASGERYVLYIGRLEKEKGLLTLLEAFVGSPHKLKIAGEGDLRAEMDSMIASKDLSNVEMAGHLSGDALVKVIRGSYCVVLPSEWYENNPFSVIEAFSCAKPVVGSRIGGIPELVRDGETGYTFTAGSARELRVSVDKLFDDPELAREMGQRAKRFVETELSPQTHYEKLMGFYQGAMN